MNHPLMLASQSPRRRMLLAELGYPFETCAPDVDEHVPGRAEDVVRTLALRKAHAAAKLYPNYVILAADTLVSLDGEPLGKPSTPLEAREMLNRLSGQAHDVFSGVCVLCPDEGFEAVRVARTRVIFRTLEPETIDAYVATGEPMDKAGAYAIQGGAAEFVERIEGSRSNVVGLPLDVVRALLELL